MRHANNGLRKICDCSRRQWSRCTHGWHVAFKHGDVHYRGSLDRLIGRHVGDRREAKAELDKLRTIIRDERPVDTEALRLLLRGVAPAQPCKAEHITLETFGERYIERVSKVRERNKSWRDDAYIIKEIAGFELSGERFGKKALGAVTCDDLELLVQGLRAKGRAASTRNHYIQILKSMFRWAVRKGYLPRSPITDDAELKRSKIARRHRRLEGDEEQRLLAAANPRLQRLIVAAIETGCRQGELLALIWRYVSLDRGVIRIRAENTKNSTYKEIPISARLRAVLEMAQHDPAGQLFGPHHYPFGNAIGQRLGSPKKAWATSCKPASRDQPLISCAARLLRK